MTNLIAIRNKPKIDKHGGDPYHQVCHHGWSKVCLKLFGYSFGIAFKTEHEGEEAREEDWGEE